MKGRRHRVALPEGRAYFFSTLGQFRVVKTNRNRSLRIPLQITRDNTREKLLLLPVAAREYLVIGAPVLLVPIEGAKRSGNGSSAQGARGCNGMLNRPVERALLTGRCSNEFIQQYKLSKLSDGPI
jgi:hypothetical protein